MRKGIIVKGIGGFYYIRTSSSEIVECKARGKFRKDNITPMVGDHVQIEMQEDGQGIIQKILPRKNLLIRPPVSNIDQAIIVFALSNPNPNMQLLDRFLVLGEKKGLSIIICINKIDLDKDDQKKEIEKIYENTGYPMVFTSTKNQEGMEELKKHLEEHITVFAGPSGVGKSSLLNQLITNIQLETGDVSKKIGRGKHTTRHVELFPYKNNGFLVDTPGFSSLEMKDIEEYELMNYFPEFIPFIDQCKFNSCLHLHEPKCAVKNGVYSGQINENRYQNYLSFLQELKNMNKY